MSLDLARPAPTTLDLGVLPSELDGGLGWRAAIGLVVLATDQTMEHEFRALIQMPGVAFYESRLFNDFAIMSCKISSLPPLTTKTLTSRLICSTLAPAPVLEYPKPPKICCVSLEIFSRLCAA